MDGGRTPFDGVTLAVISLFADLIGIFIFIGYSGSRTERLAIGGGLAVLALVSGASTIISVFKEWLSPRGAYLPPGQSRKRVLASALVLCFAVLLGLGVVEVIKTPGAPAAKEKVIAPAR